MLGQRMGELDSTRVIPLQRNASTAEAATVLIRALDAGELYRSNPARKAKRARRADRKRMRLGARQYGKAYYVPKKQFRYWMLLWWGTSLLFGAVQFLGYVAVCRWLELLP